MKEYFNILKEAQVIGYIGPGSELVEQSPVDMSLEKNDSRLASYREKENRAKEKITQIQALLGEKQQNGTLTERLEEALSSRLTQAVDVYNKIKKARTRLEQNVSAIKSRTSPVSPDSTSSPAMQLAAKNEHFFDLVK